MRTNKINSPKNIVIDLISDGDSKSLLRKSFTIDQATTLAARCQRKKRIPC